MKNLLKVAGVQLESTTDRDENIHRAQRLIGIAAERGASIVCLPQLFNTHWFPSTIDKDAVRLAESDEGPTITAMKEAAAIHGIVLISPIYERTEKGFFNTAFVIGTTGEILGRYRKVHVPQIPMWEEKSYFKPGNLGFPVIETPFARIGIQLCWDVFFPEGFRSLALDGADIIFAPTASAFIQSHERWDRAIAAAAHSNGLFIFRVNRIGGAVGQEFYGRSFCVRPDGDMVDSPGGSGEGVVLTTIDLSEIGETRRDWVFLKDRRPSLYKRISEEDK